MQTLRGTTWGPQPLPELLRSQLAAHGFTASDAASCVRQINDRPGAAQVASLFVDLGACKLLEGDVDGAVASWRHALTGDHDVAATRALLNLGLLYEHLQLHERAIMVFDSAIARAVDPYRSSAVMASARCQQAAGDSEAAMELLARLAQSEMASESTSDVLAVSLYGLGEVAAQAGRLDRAERAWQAASAAPTSLAQQAAAECLDALLLDQAAHEDPALTDHPTNSTETSRAVWTVGRIEALHRAGSDEQAAKLALTVEGASLDTAGRFRLADVRRQVGLVNEAIDELEVLVAHADVEVQQRAAFTLGEIYQDHSMHEAAGAMFDRVLRHDDDFWAPAAALALGDISATNGDRDAALDHWTRAASSLVVAVNQSAHERLDTAYDQVAARSDAGEADTPVMPSDEVGVEHPQATDTETARGDLAADETVGDVVAPAADREIADPDDAAERAGEPLDEVADDVSGLVEGDALVGVDDSAERAGEPLDEVADEVSGLVEGDSADHAGDPLDEVADDASGLVESEPPIAVKAEPQVIVLADLEEDVLAADVADAPTVEPAVTDEPLKATVFRPKASAFRTLSDPNPYAALAPEGFEDDVIASTKNPYAELAPNFDDDATLATDVEPGDWESILDDWPREDPDPAPAPVKKKGSRAFSRYT